MWEVLCEGKEDHRLPRLGARQGALHEVVENESSARLDAVLDEDEPPPTERGRGTISFTRRSQGLVEKVAGVGSAHVSQIAVLPVALLSGSPAPPTEVDWI